MTQLTLEEVIAEHEEANNLSEEDLKEIARRRAESPPEEFRLYVQLFYPGYTLD